MNSFLSAFNILLISNHNTFRVQFDKIASVYFIWKMYLHFSIGNGQPREPALCQLYRHTFVPYVLRWRGCWYGLDAGVYAGLLWQACMQVYRVGMRNHLVDIYNATDFFMLKFYTASLVLRRLADLKVIFFHCPSESWIHQTHGDNSVNSQSIVWKKFFTVRFSSKFAAKYL